MTTGSFVVGANFSRAPRNVNPIYQNKTWSGEDSSFVILCKPVSKIVYRYSAIYRARVPKIVVYNRSYRHYIKRECNYSVSYEVWRNPIYDYFNNPPNTGIGFINQFGYLPYYYDPVIAQNKRITAINRIYALVKDHDFNAAVFLGEGKEALGMIANSATRIRAFALAVKHLNYRAAAKALGVTRSRRNSRNFGKTTSDLVLEFQYGWKPLVEDAYNAANYLAQRAAPEKGMRVKSREKLVTFIDKDYNGFTALDNRGFWKYQIIAEVKRDLSDADALSLTDPATLAWELLPFSFVVDWFVPIGPYLEAVHAASVLQATYVVTEHSFQIAKGAISNDGTYVSSDGSQPLQKSGSLSRTVLTSIDVPMPVFKPLSKVFSLQHTLNALALLNTLDLRF